MTVLGPSLEPLRLQLRSLCPREAAPREESGTREREDSEKTPASGVNERISTSEWIGSGCPSRVLAIRAVSPPSPSPWVPVASSVTPLRCPPRRSVERSQCRYSEWSKPWRGRSLTLSLGVSALGSICPAPRALLCLSAFVCLCSSGSELFD